MRFYIAGPWGDGPKLYQLAKDIELCGHIVTASWLRRSLSPKDWLDADAGAREDLNDILSCDAVINFTCTPDRGYMTGGRHVEVGFAMAAGLKQFVVGPRENIFHEMVDVTQFDTFSAFINWLRMESQSAGDPAGEAVVLSGERVA